MVSQEARNWPFTFQLTIWYVKDLSGHSNADCLKEEPLSGHLFLPVICHIFSPVPTSH